ncbi:hypothetical protein O6P43_023797 [Quillaja saponaria]|uniref:Uncharacterized protein n=1 Tax=Quillaja saponaria TaxID=32244 RepID=A0AAD7LGP2_QUISA|nr:hypothetical protein O6P43_023797 [Quillaja saponaria]
MLRLTHLLLLLLAFLPFDIFLRSSSYDQDVEHGMDLEPRVEDDVPHEVSDITECAAGTPKGKRGKNKIVPPHNNEEDHPFI